MKYQVNATSKRRGKTLTTDEPTLERAETTAYTLLVKGHYRVITITRDDEGASHPDNAGKYFLHRIIL